MKIKYLVLALLPLSLMACQTVQNVTDGVVSQINSNAEKNLTEYNWTYQGSTASKPLVLSFNADQRVTIQTGCNNQGGTWKVEGNKIVTSPLVSTMMACADDLMQQERLSSDIFSEKKVPFSLSTSNDQAILTVTDSKGQKHVFTGTKIVNANVLSNYIWSYQPTNTQKPIVLTFLNHDRLSVDTGCNRLNTSWKVENGLIVTGDGASTMMACEPALMQQEKFTGELLQKRQIPFEVNTTNLHEPTLTLTDAKGQKYNFIGKMTPETKSCTGVAPQTCMQVREVKYDEKGIKTYTDKSWSLYYGQIEGFEHNPKQRVIVRVKRFEIKNPAADQSSLADVLDMVIEQEIVK